MQKKSAILLVVVLLLSAAQGLFAYDGSAPYSWGPGTPNYNPSAVIKNGTIGTADLTIGTFQGLWSGYPYANGYGDSGAIVGWDDNWVYWAGDWNNGNALDGKWLQIIYPYEGWWDLGSETNRVAVFLAQDHSPYLDEGLEVRVYGSNTLWGETSSQAVLKEVYLDGWRPHNPSEDFNGNGWTSDDISAVFELPGYYRYIKLGAWSPYSNLEEPEVDAVAGLKSLIQVGIDIKPGSYPNCFNNNGSGVIPVAVFGSPDFNIRDLDPASVSLESLPVKAVGKGNNLLFHYEDVNNDGNEDAVIQIDDVDKIFSDGDSTATLTGNLRNGTRIKGSDSICIVP